MRFYLISIIFLLSACGSDSGKICEPGKQSTCDCTGGSEGFQICLDDGTGWGLCNCACIKDCVGLECGPDRVCGESCGECEANAECNSGTCECQHLSCSGDCCAESEICHQGECCFASCAGKQCGSDGCAGDCGECPTGLLCNHEGLCVTPGCGNGIQEPGEQCDTTDFGQQTCLTAAGQTQGELSCTEGCFLDISGCHTCGNGTLEGPEDCEGSLLGGETCATQSDYTSGDLACTAECQFDTTKCYTCGNAAIEGTELCDGVLLAGATCANHSVHTAGQLACGQDCMSFDTSGCHTCGNNILEGPETCDGTNLNNETCANLTGYEHGPLACSADCLSYDLTTCHTCGNAILEGPEQCEGQDLGGATCLSVAGVDEGDLTCDPNCMYDISDCRDCGNGIAEGPEGCDGTDFRDETCADWGYEVGELQCTQDCVLNLELCFDCDGCCGHGDCMYNQNTQEAYCDCDPGYYEVEGLKCAKDPPSIWPPDIDDLWYPTSHMCAIPACDECGESGLDTSVVWRVIQTTTDSTCKDAVLGADPWSVKWFSDDFTITYPNIEGTCLFDEEGSHYGTVINGRAAKCWTEGFAGIVIVNEVKREVIDFTTTPKRGLLHVYVNANELFGSEDCEYVVEREYSIE